MQPNTLLSCKNKQKVGKFWIKKNTVMLLLYSQKSLILKYSLMPNKHKEKFFIQFILKSLYKNVSVSVYLRCIFCLELLYRIIKKTTPIKKS